MYRKALLSVLSVFLASSVAFASPKGVVKTDAIVNIFPDQVSCSLQDTLFGTNVSVGDKHLLGKPEFIEKVKKMGIKSCRFPNGCQADLYNWKVPGVKQVTVDEFMTFCEAIGAEPYYTVNMQGGTEGLKNPIPEKAPLEEVIKYQHLAPNPCGYTNYYFGTLAETLELVQKYTIDTVRHHRSDLQHQLKEQVGFTVNVEVCEPGSLPASEGKAKRVIDERGK